MQVGIFTTASDYKDWVDYSNNPIEIISVIVFNEKIVVTYKLK